FAAQLDSGDQLTHFSCQVLAIMHGDIHHQFRHDRPPYFRRREELTVFFIIHFEGGLEAGGGFFLLAGDFLGVDGLGWWRVFDDASDGWEDHGVLSLLGCRQIGWMLYNPSYERK